MKTKMLQYSSVGFIGLSALSVSFVSIMAMLDPQQVMNLVQVSLPNNDAYSSIRGVYGGVGLTIVAMLVVLTRQNIGHALLMLSLLWSLYSLSRIITIFAEGRLGEFGNQWLVIETAFAIIAGILAWLQWKQKAGH